MRDKWALEEHLSAAENNQLWDESGEAARNGQQYMDYVELHLLDVDERIKIMDATGIERTIVSLTSPGIQSITDTALGTARRTVSEYFSDNFYATISGHFHTRTLFNTIAELGADRVLFSADYPYETMEEAAAWFDNSLLSANDERKIGRENARRLFTSIA